jgi:hypothetical protein
MTPFRKRSLFQRTLVIATGLIVSVVACFIFFGEKIPSLVMRLKQRNFQSGAAFAQQTKSTSQQSLPPEALNPLKIKFEVLGGWTYTEGKTAIPEAVRKLNGKWVEITGMMLPINETQHISRFIILQSLWGCCFGQAPAANHIIVVTMEPGGEVDFYPDPIKVVGKFSVAETREEGYLISLYQLEAIKVTSK